MKATQLTDCQKVTPPPPHHIPIKYLHFIIACFLLFNVQFLIAQEQFDDFCGTPPSEVPDPPGVYSKSIDPAYSNNFEPVSFNIFFWGIADENGEWTGHQMTLQKAQDAVTLLNEHLGEFNICFNLLGMDIINSDDYHDGKTLSQIWSFATLNGLSPNPASLNVLVNYQVNIATTANLHLVKLYDTFSSNFTLDTNENEINLNLANYPIGIYAVVLIVDGQPVHAKQLIIN